MRHKRPKRPLLGVFGLDFDLFSLLLGVGLFFGFRRHIPDDFAFMLRLRKIMANGLFSIVQFPIKEVHIAGHKFTKEKAIVERLG